MNRPYQYHHYPPNPPLTLRHHLISFCTPLLWKGRAVMCSRPDRSPFPGSLFLSHSLFSLLCPPPLPPSLPPPLSNFLHPPPLCYSSLPLCSFFVSWLTTGVRLDLNLHLLRDPVRALLSSSPLPLPYPPLLSLLLPSCNEPVHSVTHSKSSLLVFHLIIQGGSGVLELDSTSVTKCTKPYNFNH